ncbi:MAG: AI-2E family transporter [Kiritimatiellae bacterium]|nr:AI-2E family transporter [Kiritimatiellia bacterium]
MSQPNPSSATPPPAPKLLPLFTRHSAGFLTLPLWFLAAVALGFVLKSAKSVVIPLVIAWLLSYVLAPLVRFLNRRLRLPNGLAILAVVALLGLLAWGAGLLVQQRLVVFAKAYQTSYHAKITDLIEQYSADLKLPDAVDIDLDFSTFIRPWLLQTSRFFASFLYNGVLVVVFLVFMLVAKPLGRRKLTAAFPDRSATVTALLDTISRQIGAYIGSLFVLSLFTGLCVWGVLAWIGVDFAFTWGLLAFVLNFIPTLGSVVASVPPVLIAFIQYGDLSHPLGVAALLVAIQFGIGNLIAPKVYGDRLDLSPVTILLFLLFWGWLWGIPGTLLSVPLAATIQITLSHIPPFAPLAVLMGSGKHLDP